MSTLFEAGNRRYISAFDLDGGRSTPNTVQILRNSISAEISYVYSNGSSHHELRITNAGETELALQTIGGNYALRYSSGGELHSVGFDFYQALKTSIQSLDADAKMDVDPYTLRAIFDTPDQASHVIIDSTHGCVSICMKNGNSTFALETEEDGHMQTAQFSDPVLDATLLVYQDSDTVRILLGVKGIQVSGVSLNRDMPELLDIPHSPSIRNFDTVLRAILVPPES